MGVPGACGVLPPKDLSKLLLDKLWLELMVEFDPPLESFLEWFRVPLDVLVDFGADFLFLFKVSWVMTRQNDISSECPIPDEETESIESC